MTVSLTVCQSQPSSTEISFTVRPHRPTCSVTHRPARSVITNRAAAIAGAASVNEPVEHNGFGHAQRRLRHTNRVRLPKQARSTSSTAARSLAATAPPQPPQTPPNPCSSQRSTSALSRTTGWLTGWVHGYRGRDGASPPPPVAT